MKTRNILVALTIIGLCHSCQSGPDYKVVRQEVVELHDKLMADGETAIQHKLQLDTVAAQLSSYKKADPKLDTAAERKQLTHLMGKLNVADESMMDWMQDFKADVADMSNEKAVAYFNGEKKKLVKMDSLYKSALLESENYLKKFNKSIHPVNDGHDHSKH